MEEEAKAAYHAIVYENPIIAQNREEFLVGLFVSPSAIGLQDKFLMVPRLGLVICWQKAHVR